MKKTPYIALLVLLGLSCKKFVTVDRPVDQINSSVVFTTAQTATSAIAGMYTQMNAAYYNNWITLYPGLSADEIKNTNPSTLTDPFTTNQLTNQTLFVGSLWNSYMFIYTANACIEGLTNATIDTALRSQLMGEAKFFRAFNYYYLINLYGDVPLELTTSYEQNAFMPRTAVSQILTQITTDLQDAVSLLRPAYPGSDRTRVNRYGALAMLARVQLLRKNWTDADALASQVLAASTYRLEDVSKVFLASSPEAILQFAPSKPGQNTIDATTFIPLTPTFKPNYQLTDSLYAAFDSNDQRRANWVGSAVAGGVTYYYPSKYKTKNSTPAVEYEMVLRLAEQYLVRAEARAHLNRIDDSKADLNAIRARAGILPDSSADTTTLLRSIEKERRKELCYEFGHRWIDLKRTGRIDQVLGAVKTGWKPTSALYPIPLDQIKLNNKLTQNPGYE